MPYSSERSLDLSLKTVLKFALQHTIVLDWTLAKETEEKRRDLSL